MIEFILANGHELVRAALFIIGGLLIVLILQAAFDRARLHRGGDRHE